MQLSDNIRTFRKERSLTQEQLAQALGVTGGAVYKWEAGISVPDISLIVELADLYWVFGFMRCDQTFLRRSIELMERALLLIGQNTDSEISEVSINQSIAKAYSAMGEYEKAVEVFTRDNPRGIHNDFIGHILGIVCDPPDRAVPYLSRALLRCVSSLDYIVVGYFNVYFKRKDFANAADILRLGLRFFADLKIAGQNNYLDKAGTELYVCLAAAQGQDCE